jgi:MoaA/NifB/PqqE/SkfB family radical SAM enzyme
MTQQAYCCYRAGPARGGRLEPANVEAWLRQIAHHPLEWVLFFGGEPFIYLDDLQQMIVAARRHTTGRPLVFTNGYWAYDPDVAHAKLSRLQAAGLDHILQ